MKLDQGWLSPASLLLLGMLPVIAGAFRLSQLSGMSDVMPANARFAPMPLPVVLHIVTATVFAILGPLQFAAGFRRRWPVWHRMAGRLLVLCGLMVGLTALWMTLFYAPPDNSGLLLYASRILFGWAMVASIVIGLVAILRRDIKGHRAWMARGYAIGLGAATQMLTLMVGTMLAGPPSELTHDLLMAAGWVINLGAAEWAIRRRPAPLTRTATKRLNERVILRRTSMNNAVK
jgi:hypothetical protein